MELFFSKVEVWRKNLSKTLKESSNGSDFFNTYSQEV